MEEKITEKLLDKIFYLQEQVAEERQENTNLKKDFKKYEKALKDCKNVIDYLKKKNNTQEIENKNEEIRAFYIGIGLTIFFYLLIKFLLWYFF